MSARPSTAPSSTTTLNWEAGHGKVKVYVLGSLHPKVASTDPARPRFASLSHADRQAQLLPKPSRWVARYREQQRGWAAQRAAKLDSESAFSANFRARQTRSAALQCFSGNASEAIEYGPRERVAYDAHRPIRDQARPCELWRSGWGMNTECEVTGLPVQSGNSRRCRYCPCVIHLAAVHPHSIDDSGQYVCPDCSREVAMSVDELSWERQRRHEARISSSAIVKLQKVIRCRNECQLFGISRHGMRRLQSLARGAITRYTLQTRVAKPRPYWARVLCAHGLHDVGPPSRAGAKVLKSAVFVVLTVVKGTDEGKQLFRFDTSTVTSGSLCAPRWCSDADAPYAGAGAASAAAAAMADAVEQSGRTRGAPFFLPGMEGSATLVATVLGKRCARLVFLGQAKLCLRDAEHRSVWRYGGRFELPLLPMSCAPKDVSGREMRISGVGTEAAHRITGSLTLELAPAPFSSSVCGMLEQKDETCMQLGVQMCGGAKYRWSCLANGVLRIFGASGDETPRATIAVKKASRVKVVPLRGGKTWQRLIAVYIGTQVFVFLPAAREQTAEWCNKLIACSKHAERRGSTRR